MDTDSPTRRERWEFRRAQSTCRWSWRHRSADGEVVRASEMSFISLEAAIEDATRNGFADRAVPRAARRLSPAAHRD